jgi:hypothetical protein
MSPIQLLSRDEQARMDGAGVELGGNARGREHFARAECFFSFPHHRSQPSYFALYTLSAKISYYVLCIQQLQYIQVDVTKISCVHQTIIF